MSTIHNYICIDFNTCFPKDVVWAFRNVHQESNEVRNKRPFRLVCGAFDDSYLSYLMNNHHVHPLTSVQCDAVWFQMRKFSITSSTAENTIQERSREITTTHLLREEYEIVLRVVGREKWLPLEDEAVDSDREDNRSTAGGDNDNATSDNNNDDDGGTEDTTIAGYWISCIDQQARQDEFICGLDDKSLDDRTIRDIVGRHKNSKPTAAITTL